ncbi:MAG: enoyl-CoA hydratase-related protein [Dehalococcoidia bacterium]|jgi:enoyl-CoA hydratase/carnithine racemase|nr:enoyl-CoA hydratase-related protein [Dehalococcoidia bacterium]
MTTNETPVIYEKRDHTAYITLNRPRALNAISSGLRMALRDILIDFRDDDDLLVAIVTGEGGRAFSAGADLKEQDQTLSRGEIRPVPMWPFRDVNLFKPVIAAIDGYCLGGGLELSLQCDIRIATKASAFGLPEPRNAGSTAGYGLYYLSRAIPIGEALYMQLTGTHIDAERAHRIGLIQSVVPDREALFVEAERIADEVKRCSPLAVQTIKRVITQTRDLPLDTSVKLAEPLRAIVDRTEDRKEAVRAFVEKRPPVWKMR